MDLNSCSKAYKSFRLEQKTMGKQSGLRVFSQTRTVIRKVNGQLKTLSQIPHHCEVMCQITAEDSCGVWEEFGGTWRCDNFQGVSLCEQGSRWSF